MTKRFGFTLAEVLITLAIIGVVAAMTMPTLINNTSGAQFKTAFKKALSILSQAVVMNIALDDYDFGGTSVDDDEVSVYTLFTSRANLTELTDTELEDYTVYLNDSSGDTFTTQDMSGEDNYVFRFNDGILFTFPTDAEECTEDDPCFGWIDANGTKGPNKTAVCETEEDDDGVDTCTSTVTLNDIYPFKFYDQTVAPASAAARAVMFGTENRSTN